MDLYQKVCRPCFVGSVDLYRKVCRPCSVGSVDLCRKVCRPCSVGSVDLCPKVCRPCTEGCATFGAVLCLFSPLFRPKRNVGRERIPSDFVDAALFAAQGASCLRPRRGDCAGERRTLLPVTSPVCAAFCLNVPRNGVEVPRNGGRGLLGTAVGDGSHLTRRCSHPRHREHGHERHPCDCHHRNRRHHCRHKAHQAHKATFFSVRLFLHRTACSVP